MGFLAYCAYFDRYRRNAPDYKDKVRARRERNRKAREASDIELPQEHDKESIEKFFVKQIEMGEECLQADDVDKAIKHFSYAVVFCPQPQSLLKYMRELLPSSSYSQLIDNLSVVNKRVSETYRRIVVDEDVE